MTKRLFHILLFVGYCCHAQVQCPKITGPLDGDVDVAVDAEISWNTVQGIDGYSVSLGTTPGNSDILNSRSAALVNSFAPTVGLPDNTVIYVTISLFLKDGTFVTCPSERFSTVDITTPPDCTGLNGSLKDVQNVKLGADIEWAYAPTASGYRLRVGTTQNGSEILPETDVGNVLAFDPPDNLPVNTEIFVLVVPYNENGSADACVVESFTTGDSNIDCKLYRPQINMPETVGLCQGDSEKIIPNDNIADGFRWYKVNEDGSESFVSEARTITVSDIGRYRFEVYNDVSVFGDTSECTNSVYISVVASEAATVNGVKGTRNTNGLQLAVLASGNGSYEYALDDIEGPFQDSNIFSSISGEDHLVFVRDKLGCGITQYNFIQTITRADFPKFFTPNSDSTNDYWHFDPVVEDRASLSTIYIFDRYGQLLSQIDPTSKGWDGTFRGVAMPSSTYWYKAVAKNGDEVQGYFALKR